MHNRKHSLARDSTALQRRRGGGMQALKNKNMRGARACVPVSASVLRLELGRNLHERFRL